MSVRDEWIDQQIGPQRVGGRYRSAYWGEEYEVLEINRNTDVGWQMTVRWDDGRVTMHCTAWEENDTVVRP